LDQWIDEGKGALSRPEGIRRLIEQALDGSTRVRPASGKQHAQAIGVAARELTNLGDKSLPADEQQRRKRKLTHGPKEFRGIRADQRKSKG
jgi:hypothetical protein